MSRLFRLCLIRASLLASVLLACHAHAASPIPKQISVCSKDSEWPPYAYLVRKNGRPTSEVYGYSVQYLKAILATKGIQAKVELRPWRRCQQDVAEGSFTMLLDASVNDERKEAYLVSRPYYAMTDVYFYFKGKPAPRIESVADLRKRMVCGLAGANFRNYGLRDDEVDASAPSLPLAMEKLKAGRCDLVLARLEIAAGHRVTNGVDYSRGNEFGWDRMPGLAPANFHMLVSKRVPYAQALLELLDQGIAEMPGSKQGEALVREFLQN